MHSRLVYVTVSDPLERARIVAELAREGWSVVEVPTGFHLLAEIADVIDGTAGELPAKIVIDELARGCTGRSIAAGLRALGVAIPTELVAARWLPAPPRREPVQACA
jgi:hypothetical protein